MAALKTEGGLPCLSHLHSLELNDNNIGNAGANALAELLSHRRGQQQQQQLATCTIRLTGNDFGQDAEDGLRAVAGDASVTLLLDGDDDDEDEEEEEDGEEGPDLD